MAQRVICESVSAEELENMVWNEIGKIVTQCSQEIDLTGIKTGIEQKHKSLKGLTIEEIRQATIRIFKQYATPEVPRLKCTQMDKHGKCLMILTVEILPNHTDYILKHSCIEA